ncbi:MAG: hypothetical protein EPN61_18470 [Burkholderiaceae bacterium]|nr:MAG: hypothetical protein EPN61_18470 [Burkholderiaceae bacterium]
MGSQKEEGPQVSPEELARIERASRQFISYTNFIRWATNFRADEIRAHPKHRAVKLLSPVQSGRFSFAIEGDTILLGTQDFEGVWMNTMPWDAGYVSDRLYLSVNSTKIMDANLHALVLGFFIDDEVKRARMRSAKYVQVVPVRATDGRVVDVQRPLGLGFPIRPGDVVNDLREQAQERVRQQDASRWF